MSTQFEQTSQPVKTKQAGHFAYLDGLKGICGIWIILFHYLLAFAIFGYVGFECGIADADKYDYYFKYFPYSIISNSSCALYLFFAMIAFFPALHYFQNNNREWVQRQAVVRYFRLMPPILAVVLLSYGIYVCNGFYNQELGALLNNTWDKFYYTEDLSLAGAFANGLFGAIWQGNADYNVVLWCMQTIFFGSYMSYAIVLFFGNLRCRALMYAVVFGLCLSSTLSFWGPMYLIFLGGITAADILAGMVKNAQGQVQGQVQGSEITAFSLLILGLVLMHIPTVVYPWPLLESIFLAVGPVCILIACARSRCLQRLLCHPFLVACGKYSFSMVLVHFPVLFSFSAWFFVTVHPHLDYSVTLALTLLTAIPINAIAVLLFQKCIDKPTSMLSKAVYSLVCPR